MFAPGTTWTPVDQEDQRGVEEKAGAARLGGYMARCPIVLERLEWDADREEVVVHPRPSRRGGPFGESERLDVLRRRRLSWARLIRKV